MQSTRTAAHSQRTSQPSVQHTKPPGVAFTKSPRHFNAGGREKNRACLVRSKNEPDFAERLFGAFFGKQALEESEPFGMKRLDADECPELYPATTTKFADPLPDDSETVALFRPLLAKTQLERKPLRLAYDANVNGWSSKAFHERVDTFGAAIVLGQTEGGAIFGGYNPSGWIGIGEDRDSIAAFLFTWPNGDTDQPAQKLPKVGGASLAVIDKPENGIQFGAEGLTIPLDANDQRKAKCRLGTYYAKLEGGGRSLFGPEENIKSTQLTQLQVFVAQGEGEEWELDGITWKSKWKE